MKKPGIHFGEQRENGERCMEMEKNIMATDSKRSCDGCKHEKHESPSFTTFIGSVVQRMVMLVCRSVHHCGGD